MRYPVFALAAVAILGVSFAAAAAVQTKSAQSGTPLDRIVAKQSAAKSSGSSGMLIATPPRCIGLPTCGGKRKR